MKHHRIHQLVLVGLAGLLLSACASKSGSGTGLYFNAIEIVNLTQDDIRNMKIEVTKFHKKFACGIVLHRSTCMIGFPKQELQGNDVDITWEVHGRRHQIGPIKVTPPQQFDSAMTHAVRFVFKSENEINLEFHSSSY